MVITNNSDGYSDSIVNDKPEISFGMTMIMNNLICTSQTAKISTR